MSCLERYPHVLRNGPRDRAHFRGQRRYYRALHRVANSAHLRPDLVEFATWRWKIDRAGRGNESLGHRLAHLEAHCTVFRRFAEECAGRLKRYQVWLHIADDSRDDGVYVHTPNS